MESLVPEADEELPGASGDLYQRVLAGSENVGAAATNALYLEKPYSPMALSRQVREILDQIKTAKRAK